MDELPSAYISREETAIKSELRWVEIGIHTRDTALYLLFIWQLLVRCDPRMDDEGLAIADVGQMAGHLQVVHHCSNLLDVSSLKRNQSR